MPPADFEQPSEWVSLAIIRQLFYDELIEEHALAGYINMKVTKRSHPATPPQYTPPNMSASPRGASVPTLVGQETNLTHEDIPSRSILT